MRELCSSGIPDVQQLPRMGTLSFQGNPGEGTGTGQWWRVVVHTATSEEYQMHLLQHSPQQLLMLQVEVGMYEMGPGGGKLCSSLVQLLNLLATGWLLDFSWKLRSRCR